MTTTYDLLGRVTEIADPNWLASGQAASAVTDAYGRGRRTMEYFSHGGVKKLTLPALEIGGGVALRPYVTTTYGSLLRKTAVVTNEPKYVAELGWTFASRTSTFIYDRPRGADAATYPYVAGRLAEAVNDVAAVAFGYDQDGTPKERDEWFGPLGSTRYGASIATANDGRAVQAQFTSLGSPTISYSLQYDSFGRPVGVVGANTGATALWATATTAVDGAGAYDAGNEATAGSDLGYTGGIRLTGGLIHLRARVYDPSYRRFLQADIVDPLRFTYTNGDPTNYIDPSGREARVANVTVTGGIIALHFEDEFGSDIPIEYYSLSDRSDGLHSIIGGALSGTIDTTPKALAGLRNITALRDRPVLAIGSGTVAAVGWQNPNDHAAGYGYRIRVTTPSGAVETYAHLTPDGEIVSVGDTVLPGQWISSIADPTNGLSTAPHLHFDRRIEPANKRESGQEVNFKTRPEDTLGEPRPVRWDGSMSSGFRRTSGALHGGYDFTYLREIYP